MSKYVFCAQKISLSKEDKASLFYFFIFIFYKYFNLSISIFIEKYFGILKFKIIFLISKNVG